MFENEIWKWISGYEDLYKASNLGNIKSYKRDKELILKPRIDKDGYYKVILADATGVRKEYRLHRLIAQTFLDNPNNYLYVNHKDENVTNNNVDNLEWCDAKYNDNYGTRNKKIAKFQIGNPGKARPIKEICFDGTEKIYPSVNEAGRQRNVTSSCIISSMKRGGKCKGSKWEYL